MANVYKTKQQAQDALNSQPFTLLCRLRHSIVPVYERNLLGEKTSPKPIGYGYRLDVLGRA
jgi:outer membrane lipoprotein-sorting protein